MEEIIDSKELAEIKRKARLWDDLMEARNTTKEDPDDTGWKRAAREQGLMEAIRQCRAAYGYSLMEAKYCVHKYLKSRR